LTPKEKRPTPLRGETTRGAFARIFCGTAAAPLNGAYALRLDDPARLKKA